MNQPKFNVGDVLYSKAWKCKFVVDQIRISASGIYYSEETSDYVTDYVTEEQCELCREPQKKKLYAYRQTGKLAEIKMFAFGLPEDIELVNHLERWPDYDIEYPEADK
jgi:hypothetical protein